MVAFRFRLASMLRLREHIKEQKYWELRGLYENRREIVAEIDRLEKQLLPGTSNEDTEFFTVFELRLRAEHEFSIAKLIQTKRASLSRLDDVIADKRVELVEAMGAVKSLEQLRLRHEERFFRAQNIAQQRLSDEIARRKYVQR